MFVRRSSPAIRAFVVSTTALAILMSVKKGRMDLGGVDVLSEGEIRTAGGLLFRAISHGQHQAVLRETATHMDAMNEPPRSGYAKENVTNFLKLFGQMISKPEPTAQG